MSNQESDFGAGPCFSWLSISDIIVHHGCFDEWTRRPSLWVELHNVQMQWRTVSRRNADTKMDGQQCRDRTVSAGVSLDLPVSFQWRAEEEREETGSDSKAKRKCGMFVCECQRQTEKNTREETIAVIVEEECESCSCETEQEVQAAAKRGFVLFNHEFIKINVSPSPLSQWFNTTVTQPSAGSG